MPKIDHKVRFTAALTLIISLFTATYFSFSNYQPKVLKEVREVKGYTTKSTDVFDLPTPRYAKGLGFDQTLNSKKFTFQTDRSPNQIHDFYNNVLMEDNWRLKKEGSTENFYTAEYRKDDYSVSIWAAFDEDTKLTFASVEIVELED